MNKHITNTVKIGLAVGALATALTGCCLFGGGNKDCCGCTCGKSGCACCCDQTRCPKECAGKKTSGVNASMTMGIGTDGIHAGTSGNIGSHGASVGAGGEMH